MTAVLRVHEAQDLFAANPEEADELLQSQKLEALLALADVNVEAARVVEGGEGPGADEVDDLDALVVVVGVERRENARADLNAGVLVRIDARLAVYVDGDVVVHDPRLVLALILAELAALIVDRRRDHRAAELLAKNLAPDGVARLVDDLVRCGIRAVARQQILGVGHELDLYAVGHVLKDLGQSLGSKSHGW